MKSISIGVDVGNYDTKTSHCSIPSGYKKYLSKPEIASKVLFYDGSYYVPELRERKPYVVDKTKDDQCLILTLFGIAEEMLFIAKQNMDGGSIQEELNKYNHIKLGLGLPPGHFNKFSQSTLAYYENKLSGIIKFTYKKYSFSFSVDKINIFPQDFVAVFKNQNSNITKKKKYYIIGIGGGTTDVVPVIDGKPDVNHCFSLEAGTRIMYQNIIDDVQRQTGETLDEDLVEYVLQGEDFPALSEETLEIIKAGAKTHLDTIIDGCIQKNVKLSLYPVVFFGGGCLLLKNQIEENEKIKEHEIIADVNANAKAYTELVG